MEPLWRPLATSQQLSRIFQTDSMMMMMMMMIPKQFSSPKLQSLSTTKTPKNEYKKDNKKEEEKNNSSPEELSSSSSSLSSLLSSLSSLLSLSLWFVVRLKSFNSPFKKNSATNSLGYTTLFSYPPLFFLCFLLSSFIRNLFTPFPQEAQIARTRGKEVIKRV